MSTLGSSRRAKFGEFVADFDSFELRKHGIRLKIQDQPFQILRLLLQRPGQLVTREEFRLELWTESTFVDFDAGLNAAVRRLRDSLNDSADKPRYIETLPRHGYRFIAAVELVAQPNSTSSGEASTAPDSSQGQHPVALPPRQVSVQAGQQTKTWPSPWVRRLIAACVLIVSVAFGAAALRSNVFAKLPGNGRRFSIAVRPLKNLTGDPQRDFFVEGMTEAFITQLAQIRSLRVTSGPSWVQLRETDLPLPEIAKRLDVDAVLEGSVLQSGPRVRIAVRLIDVPNERCRWAKEYDRDERDILDLQSEVAKQVAAEVPVQLDPAEEERLRQNRTVNTEAYEKYLEGQYLWRKRTVKSLYGSLEYFQQAVRLDPNWGPAYAGLAEAYAILGYGVMVDMAPHEAAARARAYALRAAELDATLAPPHAVLGLIKHRHDWDWNGADAEFRKAIELDPSYATGHYWYSNYFLTLNRLDHEKDQLEAARRLDPTYPLVFDGIAGNLDRSGHHDEAISIWKQAIDLEDENWGAHYDLAQAYEQHEKYEDAIREMNRALAISDGNLRIKGVMARMYAETGRQVEARAILKEIQGRPNSAFSVAEVYVALGDKERALDYLRQAMQERCGWVVFMKMLPSVEMLRSDKRFQEMIEEIDFPSK